MAMTVISHVPECVTQVSSFVQMKNEKQKDSAVFL